MTIARADLSASWYRFQATFRRRWAGYIGLLVLIGILGGVSLASFAAARRLESSYPSFLARTNPSNLNIDIGDYNPVILNRIRQLPQVRSLESFVAINSGPVGRRWSARRLRPRRQPSGRGERGRAVLQPGQGDDCRQ